MRAYERKRMLGYDDDPGRPTRPKKDTTRWCRGKVGRPHTPVIEFNRRVGKPCEMNRRGEWVCFHETVCSACEKVLKGWWDTPCPDKPEGVPYDFRKSRAVTG